MNEINYGKLTEAQEYKLDCMLDSISEQVYTQDPQPSYGLSTNSKGETIARFENGFELYILPEVIESIKQ